MKYLPIYILFLLLKHSSAIAQSEFAPVGATWYYTYNGFTTMGYEKLFSEKDTMINNLSCRKLARTVTYYDFITHSVHTWEWSPFFVRDSNHVYYFFQNDQFVLLYDFNKSAGEYWTTDAYSFDGNCKLGKIYVDSTGTEEIDGEPLKWLAVHNDSTYDGYFGNKKKIYERIGSFYYMFPAPACFIYEGGWELRCYNDSMLSYQNFVCDSLYIGIEEITKADHINIFPNPAGDFLQVQSGSMTSGKSMEIMDAFGRKVESFEAADVMSKISVVDLPPGIYFLKSGNHLTRFVKQ